MTKQAPRPFVQVLLYVGLIIVTASVLYPVMMVCKKAFEPGQQFALYTENSIGRSPSNEIPVGSGNLSRRHARVMFVHDQWMIQDLGSTNGCVVNGTRITSQPLEEGDLLELGDAVFRFQLVKP